MSFWKREVEAERLKQQIGMTTEQKSRPLEVREDGDRTTVCNSQAKTNLSALRYLQGLRRPATPIPDEPTPNAAAPAVPDGRACGCGPRDGGHEGGDARPEGSSSKPRQRVSSRLMELSRRKRTEDVAADARHIKPSEDSLDCP